MEMELPEERKMWEERMALEQTEDQSDDPFIPAKEVKPTPEEDLLIRVEL